MSDTDRNNLIATKLRELADLFHGVAQGAGPEPTKKGPGRPKKDEAPPPADEPPAESDSTVTADHPKRTELQKLGKEFAALTSVAEAQKCMKLFGESSKLVPDAELAGAIVHFRNLIKKAQPAADETI